MTGWSVFGVAAGCCLLAALVVLIRSPRRTSRRRLGCLGLVTGVPAATGRAMLPTLAARPGRRRRFDPVRLAAVLAGVLVALLVSGWWSGPVAGLLTGWVVDRGLRRLEPRGQRTARLRAQAELPFAVDLLAAALLAGTPPDRAAVAVGEALEGPLGGRLLRVGRALSLGMPQAEAWTPLADLTGAGRAVSAAVRGARSGATTARAFSKAADDIRAARMSELEATAQRAGVLVVLPLGLCFLPAFVLGGLAPVVISMLGSVLP